MHGGDPPRITSRNLQETCLNLRKLRQPLMFFMVGQPCLHLRMELVASVRRGSPFRSLGCLGMWVVCVIESFWWNVLVPWLGDGDCSQRKSVVQVCCEDIIVSMSLQTWSVRIYRGRLQG